MRGLIGMSSVLAFNEIDYRKGATGQRRGDDVEPTRPTALQPRCYGFASSSKRTRRKTNENERIRRGAKKSIEEDERSFSFLGAPNAIPTFVL